MAGGGDGAHHFVSAREEAIRRQQRDLYIPAGDTGFWQGAIRDSSDPSYDPLRAAIIAGTRVMVDLLYGDHEGGPRMIARFGISPADDGEAHSAEVITYWSLDREDLGRQDRLIRLIPSTPCH